jgi:hypothetical protein
MKDAIAGATFRFFLFVIGWASVTTVPAAATGTALVQQRDGSIKTYTNVRIAIRDAALAITSSDGQGTLVLGKAACTKVGELLRCLPYDATLLQYGQKVHIRLQSGTVWLNPTQTAQQLTYSSAHLPPRGVMLLVKTRAGTILSLTGLVDEVVK